MSANSVQWLLKSGIKSADFPDLYHAIEELQCRHPAFVTIVDRVHKSTFVLSAKKSVIERKECDVNYERFIDVELNMGQKKDKIELNMAGDAPADEFLALISIRDLNGPQFRVFLFNEESPSYLEPFYGSKCMIHVWVLPFGFNELCQHLKSAQQIITENERSSMMLMVCTLDTTFTGNSLLLDKTHGLGRKNRPIIDQECSYYGSIMFKVSVILQNIIPDYFRNMSMVFYRSAYNIVRNTVCFHEQVTFKIASWHLFLSNKFYAYAFFIVCLVYLFCRFWQLVYWIIHSTIGCDCDTSSDNYTIGLLMATLRMVSSCAAICNCFVKAKIHLYLYSTAVEIWLVPLENTYLLMQTMASRSEHYQTTKSESMIVLMSAFSIVWTFLMIFWMIYTVPLCKAYSELATFVGRKHKLQAMKSRSNRLKRKNV